MLLLPQIGRQINVSNKSSFRKMRGQHIDTVPEIQTTAIETIIRETGVDPDRLRELYYSRWAYNAWAFPAYIKDKAWETDRFAPEMDGLF